MVKQIKWTPAPSVARDNHSNIQIHIEGRITHNITLQKTMGKKSNKWVKERIKRIAEGRREEGKMEEGAKYIVAKLIKRIRIGREERKKNH